jgi:hypothetical protein
VIVEKRKHIEYEPTTFDLQFAADTAPAESQIEELMRAWLEARETKPFCGSGCHLTWLNVKQIGGGMIHVAVEWLCDECMDVLFPALAERFPSIERIYVGSDPEEDTPLMIPDTWLVFPGRRVTLDGGRVETVDGFEIASRAVTVREMREFCSATGYHTSGQRHRRGERDEGVNTWTSSYDANIYLELVAPTARETAAAECLSYFDAVEFCSWAGCRLPTEAEYLVAATIDDDVHERLPEPEQMYEWFRAGRILAFPQKAITQTQVGDKIVCRHGPQVVKRDGWDQDNRRLVDRDQPAGRIYRTRSPVNPIPPENSIRSGKSDK